MYSLFFLFNSFKIKLPAENLRNKTAHYCFYFALKLNTMTPKILEKIKEIEETRGVEVLLAVESGSRGVLQTTERNYLISKPETGPMKQLCKNQKI